jgi:hypothetical protein
VWTYAKGMISARRGCGVAVFKGCFSLPINWDTGITVINLESFLSKNTLQLVLKLMQGKLEYIIYVSCQESGSELWSIAKKAFECGIFQALSIFYTFPTCRAGYVTCMGEKRGLYIFSVAKPERYHMKT